MQKVDFTSQLERSLALKHFGSSNYANISSLNSDSVRSCNYAKVKLILGNIWVYFTSLNTAPGVRFGPLDIMIIENGSAEKPRETG